MSTRTRTLLSVATTVASLGVGVFSARAIKPADESQSGANPAANTVYVDDADARTDDTAAVLELPIVAPVFIGDDPTILDELLATPPVISNGAAGEAQYQDTGSEVIGAITEQIAFAQSDGEPDDKADGVGEQIQVRSLPYVFDEIAARYVRFPVNAFDICAGSRAGTSRSVPRRIGSRGGCPVGFAGTLNGLFSWPTPFIRGEEGHHRTASHGTSQTCPASTPRAVGGQTPVTAFSSIPLTTLRAEWRPYRSSRAWISIDVAGTSTEHIAHWTAEHDAGIYTSDALLPHCFLIDRDPEISYEVRLIGIGIDGATYESELFNLWRGGVVRPPTEASIDELTPAVNVTSWTSAGGSVMFTTRPMADEDDTACGTGARATGAVTFDDPPGEGPVADYPRRVQVRINIQVGTTLLCADIFDSSGTPIGRDTLILRTPSLQRPVITLAGVRLNPDVSIPSSGLRVSPMSTCSHVWQNTTELTGSRVADLAVLWDCAAGAFSVDASGLNTIGVLVAREDSSGRFRESRRGIPIYVDACDPICPSRSTEWYELPIPTDQGEFCGGLDRYGFEGPECTTFDGVAIVRVDYQTVPGATGTAGATLLESESLHDGPVLIVAATELGATDDWAAVDMTVHVHSDSTVTLVSATLDSVIPLAFGSVDPDDLGCAGSVAHEAATTTDFALALAVCAGTDYELTVNVVDDAGVEYELPLGLVPGIPSVVADSVTTTVDFVIAERPASPVFFDLYEFEVRLDGRSAFDGGLRWEGLERPPGGDIDGPFGTSIYLPGCNPMAGVRASNARDVRVEVSGGALTVYAPMSGDVYDTGDCSRDGLIRMASEIVVVNYTLATLREGSPIVVNTRPVGGVRAAGDAQLRIMITGDWHLELDGVRL
ncbi:MAG: hypothetical protein K8R99_06355 [Actinomycetia bacterium]|nr:hypothetical protein [Actinomycetes bacterium]